MINDTKLPFWEDPKYAHCFVTRSASTTSSTDKDSRTVRPTDNQQASVAAPLRWSDAGYRDDDDTSSSASDDGMNTHSRPLWWPNDHGDHNARTVTTAAPVHVYHQYADTEDGSISDDGGSRMAATMMIGKKHKLKNPKLAKKDKKDKKNKKDKANKESSIKSGGTSKTPTPLAIKLEEATLENTDYRRVIYTDEHQQIVLMALDKYGIRDEKHKKGTQFIRVESGEIVVFLNDNWGSPIILTSGDSVSIPPNTKHAVVSVPMIHDTGIAYPKLYTIYSPPMHEAGLVQTTNPDAKRDKGLPNNTYAQTMGQGSDHSQTQMLIRKGIHQTMREYKQHKLHSGSKHGPIVTSRKQAIAIALSEAGKSRR